MTQQVPQHSPQKAPNRADFRFFHRLRVRWAEVDMQKIVFNAHYLMYLDTAVADYWRALALPYEEAMHQLQGDLYVRKATIEYHASARYDDMLDVGLSCHRIGNSSIAFQAAIFRAEELLISGELLYVFADPASQTSRAVPQALRDILLGFEAGQPMVEVRTGDWAKLGPDAGAIRAEVFIDEQRIPKELEWDEADTQCVHAVVYNRLGQPLATGRLLPAHNGTAKLGRMAVKRVLRSGGLGGQVLAALMQASAARGDDRVILHAQRTAQAFYSRHGFEPQGEEFMEAGIPHVEMARRHPRP